MTTDDVSAMAADQRLRLRLQMAFSTDKVEVIDESAQHIGHAGTAAHGGGHYRVRIVSSHFTGVPMLQRHRMVHEQIADLMRHSIHAISLRTLAPDEP